MGGLKWPGQQRSWVHIEWEPVLSAPAETILGLPNPHPQTFNLITETVLFTETFENFQHSTRLNAGSRNYRLHYRVGNKLRIFKNGLFMSIFGPKKNSIGKRLRIFHEDIDASNATSVNRAI